MQALTLTIPASVVAGTALEGRLVVGDPAIRRVTLWLFPPGIAPEGFDPDAFDPAAFDTARDWYAIRNERVRATIARPGPFRMRLPRRLTPGVYTLVAVVRRARLTADAVVTITAQAAA